MLDREKLTQAIYQAVDELNAQLPKGASVAKSFDAPLYGPGAKLESIDLVNLIIEVEEKVKEAFGVSITIADDRAMSAQNSPFLTVGSLTTYVAELIENHESN
jgi:acyl carrier protein